MTDFMTRFRRPDIGRFVRRQPVAALAFAGLSAIVLLALLAPLISPYDPLASE